MKELTLLDWTVIQYSVTEPETIERKPLTTSNVVIYLQWMPLNDFKPVTVQTEWDEDHESAVKEFVEWQIRQWVPFLNNKLKELEPKPDTEPTSGESQETVEHGATYDNGTQDEIDAWRTDWSNETSVEETKE